MTTWVTRERPKTDRIACPWLIRRFIDADAEIVYAPVLGLGLGALYALASQGLLVIYRGSGVLNFAQGAIGMAGAYLYWEMTVKHGLPSVAAWIVAVAGTRSSVPPRTCS